jgi:Prolyl oligopeptidase, N-terminal beta-propeller domain
VNRLFYIDMSAFDGTSCSTLGPLVKLVDTFENKYSYVTNEGRTFWFRSNLNAPRYKVIKMQLPPNGSPMETDPNILAALPKVPYMLNNYI